MTISRWHGDASGHGERERSAFRLQGEQGDHLPVKEAL
jgi:hypothetical protein